MDAMKMPGKGMVGKSAKGVMPAKGKGSMPGKGMKGKGSMPGKKMPIDSKTMDSMKKSLDFK